MDRNRASSLESSKRSTDRYEQYNISVNQHNISRNRNQTQNFDNRELNGDNNSLDYYYSNEYKKSLVSKSEIKDQLELLECTVEKMFNVNNSDYIGSSNFHSVNIPDALKHEYRQMMYALKELESVLSIKKKTTETVLFTNTSSSANDSYIHKLEREIYYRDSLIKCLSDRLKGLCKANDKLINDYVNQEHLLSGELICLKRQLEKTKAAMCTLTKNKKHPSNQSANEDIENELFYLRELLCSKDIDIADLRHRLERLSRENSDLKCESLPKNQTMSRGLSNQFDRDASYLKHLSEQMKEQINTLNDSLELKNCLVDDLQTQLQYQSHSDSSRHLRDQLKKINDENRTIKMEILKQTELLDDCRTQLRIVSENNQFKDDAIVELKSCLRKSTNNCFVFSDNCVETRDNNIVTLLNSIKRYLNQQNSDLLGLIDSDTDAYHVLEKFFFQLTNLINEPHGHGNDLEFFKEYLSNEINLKNGVGLFLANSMACDFASIERFHGQMNSLLAINIDESFRGSLREYLHQCFLCDDNLRLVIEDLVNVINNVPVKSDQEIVSKNLTKEARVGDVSETINRGTFAYAEKEESHECCKAKLRAAEDELQVLLETFRKDKDCFMKELGKLTEEKDNLEKSYKVLLDETSDACTKLKNVQKDKNSEINKLSEELGSMKELKFQNTNYQQMINNLQREVHNQVSEKTSVVDSKNKEIKELRMKLSDEIRHSAEIKSRQMECSVSVEKLKEDNQCLLEKLTNCQRDKDSLEMKIKDMNLEKSDEGKSRSDYYVLKMENECLEMKRYSLASEKSILECQLDKLRNQLEEVMKKCAENHVDKTVFHRDTQECDSSRQQVDELENVLALMTGELNDKVRSLQEIRQMIKNQPNAEKSDSSLSENMNEFGVCGQLLSQKDSEISYLKTKLDGIQARLTTDVIPTIPKTTDNNDTTNMKKRICELESKVDLLDQQLTDRSHAIAHFQTLLDERESVIQNAGKAIKAKEDSLVETEKLVHLLSLQNTNIKDELSTTYDGKGELHLLKSTNSNLRDEIKRLQKDNDWLKEALRDNLNPGQSKRSFSHGLDILSEKQPSGSVHGRSVDQINKEIKKLYVNFEEKNNELKEYSLREIKSRDRKVEDLNFELKLKTDQVQNILIENIRLSDKIEDESQKSCKYEQNLLLKEELLEKLLKEKEKIRATFITELRDKNQELSEKTKTVYFLNAELHRLSSDLEILSAELSAVKVSEKLHVSQSRNLEISDVELTTLKEENSSLKFCVNLKMAETEAMKSELTIQQVGNRQLSTNIENLRLEMSEKDAGFTRQLEENNSIKSSLSNVENETQILIDNLRKELRNIKDEFGKTSDLNQKLEKAVGELNGEKQSLKQVMERLENEKMNYRDEIENLLEKINVLSNNLSNSKERIFKMSCKFEKEQQKSRRLSECLETNEQSRLAKFNELSNALQQLEELTIENRDFKNEIEKLRDIIEHLEDRWKHNSEIVEQKERIRLLESNNNGMVKELEEFQRLEIELNEIIRGKSMDCEKLKKEQQELLEAIEKYQGEVYSFESKEQSIKHLLVDEKMKCEQLQGNFDIVTNQLCILEEKWANCNGNWMDKFGKLRDKYDKLERDSQEQKYHYVSGCDRDDNNWKEEQFHEVSCLVSKNRQLSEECLRLERDNEEVRQLKEDNRSLQERNNTMMSQIKDLTSELLSAHKKILSIASKDHLCSIHCSKLCGSDRRYNSQPMLIGFDRCDGDFSDCMDLQQRNNDLCKQINDLLSQIEEKDKRLVHLENDNENNTHGNRLRGDYLNLENKCMCLHEEYGTVTPNIICERQQQLAIQSREVKVIQACTDELQETIMSQNQELDQLKSSHQMLTNDYKMCCERLTQLEGQILLANSELGNWPDTCHERTERFEQFRREFNKLRLENSNLLGRVIETNQLKEEIMELEKQTLTYRQKIICQNMTIADLKMHLNSLETCRRDNNGYDNVIGVNNENERIIGCLNVEIKSLQCELSMMHNQYTLQCDKCASLKEDIVKHTMGKVEIEERYHRQCCNMEQLSAQLFDTRDLVEQLTVENKCLKTSVDGGQSKINQLLKRADESEECLQDKSNEVRKSKRSVELLEKSLASVEIERQSLLSHMVDIVDPNDCNVGEDFGDLKTELANCHGVIGKLKQEIGKLREDNERMDIVLNDKEQQLTYYNETLNAGHFEIETLRCEINKRSSLSKVELNHLRSASEKLVDDLTNLQKKINSTHLTSTETQTELVINDINMISNIDNVIGGKKNMDKDRQDQSQASDVTYSSSKTVSWKSTHTDKKDDLGDDVLELQKAIDDYNVLINDITINKVDCQTGPDTGSKDERQKPTIKSISSHYLVANDPSRPNESVFVEVESEKPGLVASSEQALLQKSVAVVGSLYDVDGTRCVNVMELSKTSHINVGKDETQTQYFGRVMENYKELEDFFFTSMKIQFKQPLSDDIEELFENFSDRIDNNMGILNEQCRHLNAILVTNTADMNPDVAEVTTQRLTNADIKNLMNIVSIQKMQMAALNVGYRHLSQLQPLQRNKAVNSQVTSLSPAYEMLWKTVECCNYDIQLGTNTVSQMSINELEIQPQPLELHSPETHAVDAKDDSYSKKLPVKEIRSQSRAVNEPSIPLQVVESVTGNIKDDTYSQRLPTKGSLVKTSKRSSGAERIRSLHTAGSLKNDILNDSYIQTNHYKVNLKGSLNSFDYDLNQTESIKYQTTESRPLSIYNDNTERMLAKDTLDNSLLNSFSTKPTGEKEHALAQSVNLRTSESRKITPQDKVKSNDNNMDRIGRSAKLIDVNNIVNNELITREDVHLENVQQSESQQQTELESKLVSLSPGSVINTQKIVSISDSVRVYVEDELTLDDNVILEPDFNINAQFLPMGVVESNQGKHVYVQNVAEGLSVQEGKTINISKLEDSLSYASIGHFEKAMHQLNDIDYDNLDPAIDIKSRICIYGAEIDYLNEKNLFHTYAINVLSDPSRYPYNVGFLDQVDASLTEKAKHLRTLQRQFNFELHMSDKEKTLMTKILDSSFTYKQQFNDWLELQRGGQLPKIDIGQFNEIKSQLEQCRSTKVKDDIQADQVTKDLKSEKEALKLQLAQMKKIVDENESLKKSNADLATKSDTPANSTSGKQSKIPLLKNSHIDSPSSNPTKSTISITKQNSEKQSQPQPLSTPIKFDNMVSPEEVKLAISGEISIENLRRFATLLAEDNFDLAAEIEKLLISIEELRQQLKENCDILAETVDMLQNSETFVTDLERQLSTETKKTQIISSRVDNLNDIYKEVVLELQRILKAKAPPVSYTMDAQGQCNYLLQCLKALEIENQRLVDNNVNVEGKQGSGNPNTDFNFLGSDLNGGIDFEFETIMQPNGSVTGSLTLMYTKDNTKSLCLTFDIHSAKDLAFIGNDNDGYKVARFVIQNESAPLSPVNKSDKDSAFLFSNINNAENLNNNCYCGNHQSCSCCSRQLSVHTSTNNTTMLPIISLCGDNLSANHILPNQVTANHINNHWQIIDSNFSFCSFSYFSHNIEIMESATNERSDNTLSIVDENLSDTTISLPSLKHSTNYLSRSSNSLSTGDGRKNYFINYRTPIYFKKLRERH